MVAPNTEPQHPPAVCSSLSIPALASSQVGPTSSPYPGTPVVAPSTHHYQAGSSDVATRSSHSPSTAAQTPQRLPPSQQPLGWRMCGSTFLSKSSLRTCKPSCPLLDTIQVGITPSARNKPAQAGTGREREAPLNPINEVE